MTMDGVLAEKKVKTLNSEKIAEEECYDGFYAVCTTLEDDIEESFRIMKSEFHSRPVYLRREERIKAHFLTCFIALLVYRVLETRLGEDISVRKLISTMKEMKYRRVEGLGYIPCYTRNHVTDALHAASGFNTDAEFISNKRMKNILKATKK